MQVHITEILENHVPRLLSGGHTNQTQDVNVLQICQNRCLLFEVLHSSLRYVAFQSFNGDFYVFLVRVEFDQRTFTDFGKSSLTKTFKKFHFTMAYFLVLLKMIWNVSFKLANKKKIIPQ